MKVFITGASGYIGGTVAAKLIDMGHAVTGLVRSAEKADAIFTKLMGTEVELRKNFIQANAKFVKDLDI